ncbi:M48 family metallopeptidase [Chamaesiphon sp.]|uniref:M48 metallopeptidase family protein n=1 Tax=Chamaesiphon sp. TaxID=2814140 RepID=UPI00359480E9
MVIRKRRNRWGSCTPTGRIVLNLALIQVPIQCIDYIIMHEHCPLAVLNQSRKFWGYSRSVCQTGKKDDKLYLELRFNYFGQIFRA